MPIFPKTCEGTPTTGQRACVRAQSHRELSAESPARGRPRRQRAWFGRPPWNRKPHDGSPCPCSTVPDHEAGAALTGRGPVMAARGLDPAGRTRDVCLQSCPSHELLRAHHRLSDLREASHATSVQRARGRGPRCRGLSSLSFTLIHLDNVG